MARRRPLSVIMSLALVGSIIVAASAEPAQADSNEAATGAQRDLQGRISLGESSSCAVLANNTVMCWGLDAGTGPNSGSPQLVETEADGPLANVAEIGAGQDHVCALLADQTVRCWGSNTDGALGTGSIGGSEQFPSTVLDESGLPGTDLSGAMSVSAGTTNTCAVLTDRTLRCWGENNQGQLGHGVDPGILEEVGYPIEVVGRDGTGMLSDVDTVSAGAQFACALHNGEVSCWGDNFTHVLGPNVTTANSSNLIGCNFVETYCYVPQEVPLPADAIALTSGFGHVCALLDDTTAWCWGANNRGQLGRDGGSPDANVGAVESGGLPLTGVVALSAGASHTCALLNSWNVRCWGMNTSGQLGDAEASGSDSVEPVLVRDELGTATLTGVTAVSLGRDHSCALLDHGGMVCWGLGTDGQLGDAMSQTSNIPVAVVGLGSMIAPDPLAVAGGPYVVDEGDVVPVVGSGSDADGVIVSYVWSPAGTVEWSLDDPSSAAPTLEGFDDAGPDPLTLTVTDDDGLMGDDSTTVTVNNVVPTVDAGLDQTVSEGDTVLLDPASFTDQGQSDTHTATIDWGDGSALEDCSVGPCSLIQGVGSGEMTGSHVFAGPGPYTVTVTVTDDDGGIGQDTLQITTLATGACDIVGTSGDDILVGTAASETICGLSGNDVIDGAGGNDTLLGGRGDDILVGGPGDDVLDGDGGPEAGAGNDTAAFTGAAAAVTVDLASGIATGEGTDRLVDMENIDGSPFGDMLTGDNGPNVINGNAGNDTINGRAGDDTLNGGANSALPGGPNDEPGDRISFEGANGPVDADLAAGTAAGWGDDAIMGFENAFGSTYGDTISGNGVANRIFGAEGNDILNGRGGGDWIWGGQGNDTVVGGRGNDTLLGNAGNDTLRGGRGDDQILGDSNGTSGVDLLIGGRGDDELRAGPLADTVVGGPGNDTLFGNAGNDTLRGGNGNDIILGGNNQDLLLGGNGADILLGGLHNDRMFGQRGRDLLNDGSGADLFNGGGNVDTCLNAGGDDTFVSCER